VESAHTKKPTRHLRNEAGEDVLSIDADADVVLAALARLARLADPIPLLGLLLLRERRVGHADGLAGPDFRLDFRGLLLPPRNKAVLKAVCDTVCATVCNTGVTQCVTQCAVSNTVCNTVCNIVCNTVCNTPLLRDAVGRCGGAMR
jgi:hypothetical protein